MTHALTRRSVTAGLAAAVTIVPGVALAKAAPGQTSELAALIRRWWAEGDAFNALPNDILGDHASAIANSTYNATANQMIGVPARTPEDTLAAIEWLIREDDANERIHFDDSVCGCLYDRVSHSLMHAVRDYLAGVLA